MSGQSSISILILRLAMGFILLLAGISKVFIQGFPTVIDNFGKMAIPVPQILGPFVALLELVGGIGLIVGLFTRYLGVLFTIEFIVAAYTQWVTLGKGFAGARLDLMILAGALVVTTHGAGRYSVDRDRTWDM
jgi:putative oxidoreductase